MITPANTPATPPNFPETLLAFSKMSTSVSDQDQNSRMGHMGSSPHFGKHHPSMSPQNSTFVSVSPNCYQQHAMGSPMTTGGLGQGGLGQGLGGGPSPQHRFASPTGMAPLKASASPVNCNQAR